jgi:hypothetical protein
MAIKMAEYQAKLEAEKNKLKIITKDLLYLNK